MSYSAPTTLTYLVLVSASKLIVAANAQQGILDHFIILLSAQKHNAMSMRKLNDVQSHVEKLTTAAENSSLLPIYQHGNHR